jgi:hypothetical protein
VHGRCFIFSLFKNNFMARLHKGILGGFSGKVGNVVGGSWNGVEYIRSLPKFKKNAVISEKQEMHRAKFAFAAAFVMPLAQLFNVTFRDYAKRMAGINSALQYTINNVVTGSYPTFGFDFTKALLAKGPLPNGAAPTCSSTVADTLAFDWIDNSGNANAKPGDKAIMVAYCDETKQSVYQVYGPDRSVAGANLVLSGLSGKTVHTWLSFISEKGEVATSVYTGPVVVA